MNHENYDPDDRIAALATAWAESAIAVIRTSGEGSIEAVDALFSGNLTDGESRKMVLRYDPRPRNIRGSG